MSEGKNIKVLAVDDDPLILEVLHEQLEENFECITCTTATEAYQQLEHFIADVVILDINMPEMNGMDFCRQLRTHPRCKYIKIIFSSGDSSRETRINAYKAGGDDYLVKPYDPAELEAKLKVFSRLKCEEEFLAIRGNMLSLFSHETRTPLTGLLAGLEIMQEDTRLSEEYTDIIVGMQSCANRLLDYSNKASVLSGNYFGFNAKREECNLAVLLEDSLLDFKQQFEKKGIAIQMDCPKHLCLWSSKEVLHFVLKELIDNAITHGSTTDHIVIKATESNGKVIIDIVDNGKGMDSRTQSAVFKAFLCKQDIEHHSSGHGLALAVCGQILELQGAHLRLHYSNRDSTCFRIELQGAQKNGRQKHEHQLENIVG